MGHLETTIVTYRLGSFQAHPSHKRDDLFGETNMKAHEAMIAWTPARFSQPNAPYWNTRGQVKVGPLLHTDDGGNRDRDWTKGFAYTGGAAFTDRRKLRGDASAKMLLVDFVDMVVRDGIDPLVAHRAFMAIDEYRNSVAEDTARVE
jgi:hypothetical protein